MAVAAAATTSSRASSVGHGTALRRSLHVLRLKGHIRRRKEEGGDISVQRRRGMHLNVTRSSGNWAGWWWCNLFVWAVCVRRRCMGTIEAMGIPSSSSSLRTYILLHVLIDHATLLGISRPLNLVAPQIICLHVLHMDFLVDVIILRRNWCLVSDSE